MNLTFLLMVTDLGRTTAQKAIEALLETGELRRVGEGVKGSPYRFWCPGGIPRPGAEPEGDGHTPTDHENGAGYHESAEDVPSTSGPREG